MFLSSQFAVLADNVAPTANFTSSCVGLACSVNASKSSDPDGGITDYSVDYGDGTVEPGPISQHTYAADGQYTITVTVTDNRGLTGSKQRIVNVAQLPNVDPTADFTFDCFGLDCDFFADSSSDSDGSIVDYQWDFGDTDTGSGVQPNHVYQAGGTYDVTLTVTDDRGGTDSKTLAVMVDPIPTTIAFRDAVSADGGNSSHVNITVPATVQPGDLLLWYVSNGNTRTADVPGGWTQLGTRSDSELTTQVFWRFAGAGTAGTTVSTTLRDGVGNAGAAPVVSTLAAYSGVDTPPISTSASVDEPSSALVNQHTTPGISVPATGAWVLSYWADRTSATTGATTAWTVPGSQARLADEFSSNSDSRVSSVLTDDGRPALSGARSGLTATADAASRKATMWTIVLQSQ